MKFFKLKVRRADILLIPIAFFIMFIWQYNAIKSDIKKQDQQISEKLDTLSKQCRQGNKVSCDEYTKLLDKSIKENNRLQ